MNNTVTLARHAIGNLLDGHPPNGDNPSDMGRFAECYNEMVRAYGNGNTEAARLVYVAYAERDAEIAGLRAGDPEPRKPPRTRYTVAELYATEFEPTREIVPGLLVEGQTLLLARPKIGKSWMASQLSVAVGTGGQFLGQSVQKGRVFSLSLEDYPKRMRSRLLKQKAPRDAQITLEHRWPSLAEKGSQLLMDEVERGGYDVVIIDTLQRAMPGLDLVKNGARVTDVLAKLQEWALEKHIAMLIIHHSRKGGNGNGDNPIDDALGATGIAGNVDASWLISRQRGQRDATFNITGRDIEERSLSIQFDKELFCWQLLGDANAVRADTVQHGIITAITELGGTATITKIARWLDQRAPNVSREINELVAKGHVIRGEREGREVPYSLPEKQ